MPRDLPFLAASIFDTPLMIRADKLDTILRAVGPRILDGGDVDPQAFAPRQRGAPASRASFRHGGYLTPGGLAVLPVLGTLVRRGSFLESASGMTSYAGLSRAADEMFGSDAVGGIMLELDTHGGEANGVFDLARHIRKLRRATGKPVWAHCNEIAASAGYAIASAADRIWIPTTGEVGSIGVLTAHIDMSGADRAAGLKWTYISAGDHKLDGNPHEPLADEVRVRIQADVDDLMTMFVSLVASNRPGLNAAAVRATKADTYRGRAAIDAGLADRFGSFDEAVRAMERVI